MDTSSSALLSLPCLRKGDLYNPSKPWLLWGFQEKWRCDGSSHKNDGNRYRCIFCTTVLGDRHVWSSSEVRLLFSYPSQCYYFKQDKYICYQTKLGSIHLSAVKPIYWYWVMMKENAHYFGVPSIESKQWGLKKHKLPSGFQAKVFKTAWEGGGV